MTILLFYFNLRSAKSILKPSFVFLEQLLNLAAIAFSIISDFTTVFKNSKPLFHHFSLWNNVRIIAVKPLLCSNGIKCKFFHCFENSVLKSFLLIQIYIRINCSYKIKYINSYFTKVHLSHKFPFPNFFFQTLGGDLLFDLICNENVNISNKKKGKNRT